LQFLSHGTVGDCNSTITDFYSSIRKSWNILQPQLSPNNEEAFAVLGNDPISACQSIINLNGRFFPGNDWQVKNQIIIQASQQVNVANVIATSIEQSPYNVPAFNSDYIIRASNRITINPGFRINAPLHSKITGNYAINFDIGNQNKVSFQISTCTPFIDECGVNHSNTMVIPADDKDYTNHDKGRGVYANAGLNFKVYPNPTNGSVILNIKSDDNLNAIRIVDVFGKVVYNKQTNEAESKSFTISLSGLSAGIYFVSAEAVNGQSKSQKIIVN